jgi:hypothetical protein
MKSNLLNTISNLHERHLHPRICEVTLFFLFSKVMCYIRSFEQIHHIIKHYALSMSGGEIAKTLKGGSKSGVYKFLAAFEGCKNLCSPLPEGITNFRTAGAVYGPEATASGRDLSCELPDYEAVQWICPLGRT